MSTQKVCDRCGKPIDGRRFGMVEQCIGDGNAYAMQVLINNINAKGWRVADLHDACAVDLIGQLVAILEPQAKG